MPLMKKCLICNKLYAVDKCNFETSKYCSYECMGIAKHTGHNIKCTNCGKEFYRRQYHIDRQENHFCCQECSIEYRHKQAFEIRNCLCCNKEFECSKKSTQTFCSVNCKNDFQKTLIGENNPKYKREVVKCDYCHEDMICRAYKLDKNHFCSNECRQNWFANIYSQDAENKKMWANKVVNNLSNGKYSNPNVYDLIKYEMQKKKIKSDKNKKQYVKDTYGFNILYLWETDIIKNYNLCEKLIQLYISSNGILDNYNSFNYHLEDEQIKLNPQIISPYYDYDENDLINKFI